VELYALILYFCDVTNEVSNNISMTWAFPFSLLHDMWKLTETKGYCKIDIKALISVKYFQVTDYKIYIAKQIYNSIFTSNLHF
jgi:hypothetical protein